MLFLVLGPWGLWKLGGSVNYFGESQNLLKYVKMSMYVCIFLAERTDGFPKCFIITMRCIAVGKCHQGAHDVPFLKRTTSLTPRRCVCGLWVSHSVNVIVKTCVWSHWWCARYLINISFAPQQPLDIGIAIIYRWRNGSLEVLSDLFKILWLINEWA